MGRRRLLPSSIKLQLRLIVLIMAVPVIGLMVFAGLQQRREAMDLARMDTLRLVDSIAHEQETKVASARQLMVALSQLPEVRERKVAQVNRIIREMLALNRSLSNLLVADRSGRVWASAVPTPSPFLVGDRRYFMNAIKYGRLSSGEFIVTRSSNKPAINLGYPIVDARGETQGVIAVAFVLESYRQVFEMSKFPADASFLLLDHRGTILYRPGEPEKYIGKEANPEQFRQIVQGADEYTDLGLGLAIGDPRIISTKKLRLEGEDEPYMYIRAGIPIRSVLLGANRQFLTNMALLAGIFLVALVVANSIGKHAILSRLALLEAAASGLANGEQRVKLAELIPDGELGRLARSFDRMAAQLEARTGDLVYSEERLRSFIRNAPVILFALDRRGMITFSDGKGLESLGLVPGQVVGLSAFELYQDSPTALAGLQRVMAGETCIVDAHVGGKVYETSYNPTRDEKGALTGAIGVAVETTERKSQEQALQRLNRLFNLLSQLGQCLIKVQNREELLQSFCAIAVRAGDFPLVWVSWLDPETLEAVPVAKAGEACGYLEGAHFRADDSPAGRGPAGTCLREGRSVVVQDLESDPSMALWREKAVSFGLKALAAFPLRLQGRIVGSYMVYARESDVFQAQDIDLLERVAQDISFGLEHFAAEGERARLQDQLLQSQKLDSLGSLAGGVAHDFNNMLTGILGYAELLAEGEGDPARQKYLQAILSAASRSADLTQKLLAFGRRGRNLKESIDLQSLVQDCLEMIRPSIRPGVHVEVRLGSCPPVDGDPAQIHQVVMNLCINAMEAMGESGTLTLASRRVLPGEARLAELDPACPFLELSVADTGSGMTEEVRQRVFEPFFTTKNAVGMLGAGLGLSTTYGIVRAHGGTLAVDSAPGQGSTFRVFLPEGTLPPVERELAPGAVPGRGRILVVEDEPLLRDLAKTSLESLGYEVTVAADGVEAVAAFHQEHAGCCAILLDLKMPRMGGREAFHHMRQIDPWVPVIICTGYGENEEVQELLTSGAVGMIAKPYKLSTLAAKLGEFLA